MRRFFYAAFMLLFVMAASAQQNVIKGKVFNEKGIPLSGATVSVRDVGVSMIKNTTSDGSFVFENLQEKVYALQISFLGYETVTHEAKVNEETLIYLTVKAYSINEISVYSLRATDRSAVAYTNIVAEELKPRNLAQDIPFLLSLTPSFVATSEAGTGIGYTGFRIRGTDANRINMTINGIPYNDAESQTSFLVNVSDLVSSVSSIQVQRGVGTSTNGAAAFGASINMETGISQTKPYAEVSGTYGSFNTRKYTIKAGTGILDNKLAFDARISGINSDGYIDRAFVDLKSYFVSAGYYGDKTTVKFLTFGGKEKTYLAWNGVDLDKVASEPHKYTRTYNESGEYIDDDGNVQYYDNQTDNYTQLHYQLHWQQKFTPNLNLQAGLHYTDGKGYYEEYRTERKYLEYGLTQVIDNGTTLTKTDLIRQKQLDNDFYGLTFALNYTHSRFDASLGGSANRYDGAHFGKVLWVRNPADDFNPKDDWYRNKGVKDDANIYLKTTAEVVENLFASVDLQYRYVRHTINGSDDKYDENTNEMRKIDLSKPFSFFNPKVGLNYKLNKNNSVYASFSVGNREPNRNNYTDASENERPTSERLYDTEIGYRFQSPKFSGGINLYNMQYKNQLILTGKVSEIGEALTTNIADSYRRGIELVAGVKISEQLKWDGNLTISQNKINNFTEYVDEYDAAWNWTGEKTIEHNTTNISYSPNLIFNSIVSFKHKQFGTSLHSSYVGKQYIDNTSSNDRAINSYFVNNLALNYSVPIKFGQKIDFQLLINNLFNTQYESNGYNWYTYILDGQRYNEKRYFPQAGTNFLAAATFSF